MDFRSAVPQDQVDRLYDMLYPENEDPIGYDFMFPAELKEILSGRTLEAPHLRELLGSLKRLRGEAAKGNVSSGSQDGRITVGKLLRYVARIAGEAIRGAQNPQGGFTVNDLVQEKLQQLTEVCAKHHVRRLELFGSAATAERFNRDTSDLDFLVEFGELSPGEYADAYFGLLEDIEDLFHRPVDLVMTTAIKNPYFVEGIASSRIVVYAA